MSSNLTIVNPGPSPGDDDQDEGPPAFPLIVEVPNTIPSFLKCMSKGCTRPLQSTDSVILGGCGHIICSDDCLKELTKGQKELEEKVTCPKCTVEVPNLSKKVLLNETFVNAISKNDVKLICGYCVFNNAAEMYCTDCKSYLCSACGSMHKNIRKSAYHNLLKTPEDIEDRRTVELHRLTNKRSQCKLHPKESADFFCVPCKISVCALCCKSDGHHQHEVYDVSETRSNLDDDIATAEALHLTLQSATIEIGKKLFRNMPRLWDDIMNDLNREFASLVSISLNRATVVREKTMKLFGVEHKVIDNKVKMLDSMEIILRRFQTISQNILDEGDDDCFIYCETHLEPIMDEISHLTALLLNVDDFVGSNKVFRMSTKWTHHIEKYLKDVGKTSFCRKVEGPTYTKGINGEQIETTRLGGDKDIVEKFMGVLNEASREKLHCEQIPAIHAEMVARQNDLYKIIMGDDGDDSDTDEDDDVVDNPDATVDDEKETTRKSSRVPKPVTGPQITFADFVLDGDEVPPEFVAHCNAEKRPDCSNASTHPMQPAPKREFSKATASPKAVTTVSPVTILRCKAAQRVMDASIKPVPADTIDEPMDELIDVETVDDELTLPIPSPVTEQTPVADELSSDHDSPMSGVESEEEIEPPSDANGQQKGDDNEIITPVETASTAPSEVTIAENVEDDPPRSVSPVPVIKATFSLPKDGDVSTVANEPDPELTVLYQSTPVRQTPAPIPMSVGVRVQSPAPGIVVAQQAAAAPRVFLIRQTQLTPQPRTTPFIITRAQLTGVQHRVISKPTQATASQQFVAKLKQDAARKRASVTAVWPPGIPVSQRLANPQVVLKQSPPRPGPPVVVSSPGKQTGAPVATMQGSQLSGTSQQIAGSMGQQGNVLCAFKTVPNGPRFVAGVKQTSPEKPTPTAKQQGAAPSLTNTDIGIKATVAAQPAPTAKSPVVTQKAEANNGQEPRAKSLPTVVSPMPGIKSTQETKSPQVAKKSATDKISVLPTKEAISPASVGKETPTAKSPAAVLIPEKEVSKSPEGVKPAKLPMAKKSSAGVSKLSLSVAIEKSRVSPDANANKSTKRTYSSLPQSILGAEARAAITGGRKEPTKSPAPKDPLTTVKLPAAKESPKTPAAAELKSSESIPRGRKCKRRSRSRRNGRRSESQETEVITQPMDTTEEAEEPNETTPVALPAPVSDGETPESASARRRRPSARSSSQAARLRMSSPIAARLPDIDFDVRGFVFVDPKSVEVRPGHGQMKITNVDANEDYCNICKDGGDDPIICCDKCPKVFHGKCHIPALLTPPDEDPWECGVHWSVRKIAKMFAADAVAGCRELVPGNPMGFAIACKFMLRCYQLPNMEHMRWEFPPYYLSIYGKYPVHIKYIRERLTLQNPEGFASPTEMLSTFRQLFQQAAMCYKKKKGELQLANTLFQAFKVVVREDYPDFGDFFNDISL